MTEHEAIFLAVKILGGQTATAKILSKRMNRNITQSHVYNWLHRNNKLPEKYVFHVEAATEAAGQKVPAETLCNKIVPVNKVS